MSVRPSRPAGRRGVASAIAFALVALLLFLGASFAAGFAIGKLLI
jgi:hypothetical protein